ncbi:hypothetical protein ACFV2H_36960 [Streptomyces sp. NPDC059629]|uniref:hypothetical protein n=1 Tax=Streptomyces sp. NPDC059629 TaxID=3346889 RepID=UPI00368A9FF9
MVADRQFATGMALDLLRTSQGGTGATGQVRQRGLCAETLVGAQRDTSVTGARHRAQPPQRRSMGATVIATHRPTTGEYATRFRRYEDPGPGVHAGSR